MKTLTFIEPTRRINPGRSHGPRKRHAASTSTNWSGAVAPAGASPFASVTGSWTVPAADAPLAGSWFYAATWIGLDGDGSADVCQAGVETDVYIPARAGRGRGAQAECYAWWEWYPAPEMQITNLVVAPGDMVTATITLTSPATASLVLANLTTGVAVRDVMTAPPGSSAGGNCAEWIMEAPTVGGAQAALADFGQVYFEGSAADRAGGSASASSGAPVDMVSASGSLLSAASPFAPDIARCRYMGPVP